MEEKQGGKKKGIINNTLLELFVGILFWGVICQAAGVWIVKDKPGYSIGLFLGLMGLKVAAYLQPFTHKICAKFYQDQFGTD